MKPSLIAAIVLAAFVYLAPGCQGKQYPAYPQEKAGKQLPVAGGEVHSDAKTKTANDQRPQWYKSPEWVLVIVGVVTALVIGWQSWEARKAAEAALLNARAVIDSERGLLVAELIPICARFGDQRLWYRPVADTWVPLSEAEILAGVHLEHRLRITNLGRTAAKIDEVMLRSEFLEDDSSNQYRSNRDLMTVIGCDYAIAGSGSCDILTVDIDEWKRRLTQEIGDSKKTVLLYGVITYFHVFSKTDVQECWFRYCLRPDAQGLEKIPPKRAWHADT
jgi:hypothetical protein